MFVWVLSIMIRKIRGRKRDDEMEWNEMRGTRLTRYHTYRCGRRAWLVLDVYLVDFSVVYVLRK